MKSTEQQRINSLLQEFKTQLGLEKNQSKSDRLTQTSQKLIRSNAIKLSSTGKILKAT